MSFGTLFAVGTNEPHQGGDLRASFASSAARGLDEHGSLKSKAHSREARSQGSLGADLDASKL